MLNSVQRSINLLLLFLFFLWLRLLLLLLPLEMCNMCNLVSWRSVQQTVVVVPTFWDVQPVQSGIARGRSSKCNKSAKMLPLELPAWDVQCSASRYTLSIKLASPFDFLSELWTWPHIFCWKVLFRTCNSFSVVQIFSSCDPIGCARRGTGGNFGRKVGKTFSNPDLRPSPQSFLTETKRTNMTQLVTLYPAKSMHLVLLSGWFWSRLSLLASSVTHLSPRSGVPIPTHTTCLQVLDNFAIFCNVA